MDKISGIVPSSARVTNVDLAASPGVRTTQPNMDRGVGAVANIAEQVPGSPAWKSKEARQAALVTEVSNSFFMKPKPMADDVGTKDMSAPREAHLQQPDGLFPKGSFIDRNA